MKTLKEVIWKVLTFFKIEVFYLLAKNSALEKKGWFKSYYLKISIDKEGSPLPWYTYSFLEFIEGRINKSMDVFEYGCGSSTLWYSGRVKNVISVEHNEIWYNEMSKRKGSNSTLILRKDPEEYTDAINDFDRKFDIVVIDAIERNECVRKSISELKEDGIIIFDNSERSEYKEGYDLLINAGFKRLDFWGMGPVNTYEWCTSIFYREKNCLNI